LTQGSTSTTSTPSSRGVSRRNSADGEGLPPVAPPVEMQEIAQAELDVAEATGEVNADGLPHQKREENLQEAKGRLDELVRERDVTEPSTPNGSRVEFALPPRS
jgi:hypothetical protein